MEKISFGKNNQGFGLIALVIIITVVAAISGLVFLSSKKSSGKTEVKSPLAATKAPAKKAPTIPKLTLENIFATQSASLADLDQSKIIKLVATGDVIPARGANWPAVKSGNYHINWEFVGDLVRSGDLTVINLEAPLFASCQLQTSGLTFCGAARQVEGLTWAGVDVASLANNHIGNYGDVGIDNTEKLLDAAGIAWSGFDHLATKTVKGVIFGFLAYNGVGTHFSREGMQAEIAAAKKQVDILVVSVHWGEEYVAYPAAAAGVAPDDPKEIAHLIIDAGADLIVGNHPHWVQGVEMYKNGFITYAHGNLIFDQTWSEETEEGVIGEYTFYNKKLIQVHFNPTKFDTRYQPWLLSGPAAQVVLDRMKTASTQLAQQ